MTRPVPFLDLAATHAAIREELDAATTRVLDSGWFVLGPEVEAFEREFAAYCGAAHCVGVNSGLDAIELLLRAHGIGEGDEVVVPAHTFVATWLGVSRCGATPVPAAVRPGSYDLDPESVTALLTARTRAIMPVHLYGLPAEMQPLRELARDRGLLLLEDAAQAHGARDAAGERCGALADGAAFSFYPGKNLGALGDGGAILTGDGAIADRCRALRNYGSAEKYRHDIAGGNTRLDELQAALLRVKLVHLDDWNARRREIAGRYLAELDVPGIGVPVPHAETTPAWHLFVIRHANRDRLQRSLAEAGIASQIHYPVAPHETGAYSGLPIDAGVAAGAAGISREVLSLPIGPSLAQADVDRVIGAVAKAQG